MTDFISEKSITNTYNALAASISGFVLRAAQKQMSGAVMSVLTGVNVKTGVKGPTIGAIEAPTGVGKSLGYLTGAIPVAMQTGKKLVISTATVALQEQLCGKDIPQFRNATGMPFAFALAKGRGRYACPLVLGELTGHGGNQLGLSLGEDDGGDAASWPFPPMPDEMKTVQQIEQGLLDGSFNGDLDDWTKPIPDRVKPLLSISGHRCVGSRCPHFSTCPFFKAREQLDDAQVIVANHSLVLADLLHERQSTILPAPEDCLYVFDEAHNLPRIAVDAVAARLEFADVASLHKDAGKNARLLTGILGTFPDAHKLAGVLVNGANDALLSLKPLEEACLSLLSPEPNARYVFPYLGPTDAFVELAAKAGKSLKPMLAACRGARTLLMKALDDHAVAADVASRVLAQFGRMADSLGSWSQVCDDVELRLSKHDKPIARWIERDAHSSPVLSTNSVSAAEPLWTLLWSKAAGAVLTSATLKSLGHFGFFFDEAGLPFESLAVPLDSPFNLTEQAELCVPSMASPKEGDAHTRDVVRFINTQVDLSEATLVLFTSRAQMRAVAETVSPAVQARLLMQGHYPRTTLLAMHRQAIDRGEGSVVFGLASFGEGLDLPGDYCRHVVIARIPFEVPDSPLEQTYSEWLTDNGRNAFMEMSLPRAGRKLTQWCGRLVRSETDYGRISILDPRLNNTKGFGKALLEGLPPFRRGVMQRASGRGEPQAGNAIHAA